MIRGFYSSYNAMNVLLMNQDVIANNIANANTAGYKADVVVVESFPSMLFSRIEGRNATYIGRDQAGVLISTVQTNMEMGKLQQTDRELDIALAGNAFFAVQTANGVLYTKGGNFHISPAGFLSTGDGSLVLGSDGNPINITGDQLIIDREGNVTVDGEERGALLLAAFANLEGLIKVGDSYFAAAGAAPIPAEPGQVVQGYLEIANIDPVTEMVKMIEGLRAYEANQRIISAQDNTLGKVVNEVGRVR